MRNQLKNNLGKITDFKGTPLFGQDSIPQNTSNFLAIAGTILFWFILLIVLLFAKPIEKKPKYKEVQIVLSSTPTVKKEESPAPAEAASSAASKTDITQSEPVEAPAPVQPTPTVEKAQPVTEKKSMEKAPAHKPIEKKPEPKSVEKKPEPKPVQKTEAKPAVTKTTPAVTEPVEEYAIDPMEAFAQQTQKKTKKEFDWSKFDDEAADEVSSSSEPVKKIQNNEPLFSGSAAAAAESSSQTVTSSSSTSKSVNNTASSSTSSALANIANSIFSGKAANGVESETNVKSAVSGNGKVMLEMSNGSSRALLDPAKPVIKLSEAAASTIDGSRTVKIRFRVVEAGNVPRGEIRITPESVLTDLVRNEIFDQLSRWRFEPADYSAFAEFDYKIVKR